MQRPAMRLTVGPHPPTVYWRRRAFVAAGLLVLVLLGWFAIRGGGSDKPAAVTSAPAAGTGQPAAPGPSGTQAAPRPTDLASPSFVPASPEPTTAAAPPRSPAPANVAPCTDDQITVTVTTTPSPGVLGGTFTFNIAIASKAADWCSRDLGAGAQEIRIMHDGALLFSSDVCNTSHATDVRAFAAGDAVRYTFTWSSYRANPHACDTTAAPAPVGRYQVIARIGTKESAPTEFTINR
ncbi:hypothetical protein [Dactylosporangium sp. CA-139066]|uniref:hypothetical protein n=1 Tax=Dactylosporangium sp. CA-139066 TaxID=3239930 RepID=UPI003D8B062B